ncbi:MAG: hypothetical protein WBA11_18570, partial [Rubrivirga sp.]
MPTRRPARVGGLAAVRYRLRRFHPYTGDADLDAAFSTFDAVVVPPSNGRSGVPLVSLLNGITEGLDRSIPAAKALSKAGLGAVLIDTPLGGGHPGTDLAEMARRGVALDVPLARRLSTASLRTCLPCSVSSRASMDWEPSGAPCSASASGACSRAWRSPATEPEIGCSAPSATPICRRCREGWS